MATRSIVLSLLGASFMYPLTGLFSVNLLPPVLAEERISPLIANKIDIRSSSKEAIDSEIILVSDRIKKTDEIAESWENALGQMEEIRSRFEGWQKEARLVLEDMHKAATSAATDSDGKHKFSAAKTLQSPNGMIRLSMLGGFTCGFLYDQNESTRLVPSVARERGQLLKSISSEQQKVIQPLSKCWSQRTLTVLPDPDAGRTVTPPDVAAPSPQDNSPQAMEQLNAWLTACVEAIKMAIDGLGDQKINSIFDPFLVNWQGKQRDNSQQREALLRYRSELMSAKTSSMEINNGFVVYAPAILGAVVLIIIAVPRLYSEAVQVIVFNNDLIIQLFTVLLLTTTILILGITEKIPANALGTLLGGISGYVLGRTSGRGVGSNSNSTANGDSPPTS